MARWNADGPHHCSVYPRYQRDWWSNSSIPQRVRERIYYYVHKARCCGPIHASVPPSGSRCWFLGYVYGTAVFEVPTVGKTGNEVCDWLNVNIILFFWPNFIVMRALLWLPTLAPQYMALVCAFTVIQAWLFFPIFAFPSFNPRIRGPKDV